MSGNVGSETGDSGSGEGEGEGEGDDSSSGSITGTGTGTGSGSGSGSGTGFFRRLLGFLEGAEATTTALPGTVNVGMIIKR